LERALKPIEGRVRAAGEGDLERILEIEQASFTHPWSVFTFKRCLEESTSMVCEEEGILGFLIATLEIPPWEKQPVAHLHNLAVDPGYRRKGVASALLKVFLKFCKVERVRTVSLEVRRRNTGAIRFYKRQGFKRKRRMPHFYEDGEDAFLMEGEL